MPNTKLESDIPPTLGTAHQATIDTSQCTLITKTGPVPCDASLVREEPLEIQLNGKTFLVTMRTPGHDQDLTHGLLLTERVIRSAADVQSLHHCSTSRDARSDGNLIKVTLRPDLEVDFEGLQRNLFMNSSCGLCGKTTVENALQTAPPLTDAMQFSTSLLTTLSDTFRSHQTLFEQTGGAHAAALFSAQGELLVLREDVGRHNAVDKALGWASQANLLPLSGQLLMVSGRISFEIVQKALVARVPIVVGISAPTSLAVDLAEKADMALVGFLRDKEMNLYGNTQRIRDAHP